MELTVEKNNLFHKYCCVQHQQEDRMLIQSYAFQISVIVVSFVLKRYQMEKQLSTATITATSRLMCKLAKLTHPQQQEDMLYHLCSFISQSSSTVMIDKAALVITGNLELCLMLVLRLGLNSLLFDKHLLLHANHNSKQMCFTHYLKMVEFAN